MPSCKFALNKHRIFPFGTEYNFRTLTHFFLENILDLLVIYEII